MHVKKGLDSAIRRVEGRAAELVGMQSHNVEGLQIVSYTDGQKFEVHHDIGPIDEACEHVVTVVPPRRIITFFVYLNDLPQGIGTTNFPLLKPSATSECLKVQPKRGRALLFCNVLVDDPSEPGTGQSMHPPPLALPAHAAACVCACVCTRDCASTSSQGQCETQKFLVRCCTDCTPGVRCALLGLRLLPACLPVCLPQMIE